METRMHDWKRLWCPREGRVIQSDRGYLLDPDSQLGRIQNPDVVSFESIGHLPCLILLGEPGIGKTTAMNEARRALDSDQENAGDQFLWLDLADYGSEQRLFNDLFTSDEYRSWVKGNHRLYIFLDTLDLCMLRIDTLTNLLPAELRKHAEEARRRMFFRVACRTADWPSGLENGLTAIWGEEGTGVYELTPLRCKDVIAAANDRSIDSQQFLEELTRKDVVSLAIKPITLDFLLRSFSQQKSLPDTRTKLYEDGCRLLCVETSQNRIDASRRGVCSADQRMAIAARIAAVTVIGDRQGIWTDIDRGNVPEGYASVRELVGEHEVVAGCEFPIDEGAVREALATGLFSSRGPQRLGWAHHTYAEFLAAWYLIKHGVTVQKAKTLLVHPGDRHRKLVPQLRETAAWLASLDLAIFRMILEIDPIVLLRSDSMEADVEEKRQLTDRLLTLCEAGGLQRRKPGIATGYERLAHPNLGEKVQQYIIDRKRGLEVRLLAMDIARECGLEALTEDLLTIALAPDEQYSLRLLATKSLCDIGDGKVIEQLAPLAKSDIAGDCWDELKGICLQVLWPKHWTTRELLPHLSVPTQTDFFGFYRSFLTQTIPKKIPPEDLPMALEWISSQHSTDDYDPFDPFLGLEDAILLKAWNHIEESGVAEALAKTALQLLLHLSPIMMRWSYGVGGTNEKLSGRVAGDDENRRRLLKAMIPHIHDPATQCWQLVRGETSLALNRDIPWMLERLLESSLDEEQRVWAQLILVIHSENEPRLSEMIFDALQRSPILTEACGSLFTPVELASPTAQQKRESFLRIQQSMNRRSCQPLLEPPPIERVEFLLNAIESGKTDAWARLVLELTLEGHSQYYGDWLTPDLRELPGWKEPCDATRTRIVNAAREYILKHESQLDSWLGTGKIHQEIPSGYQGLRLLYTEDPVFINSRDIVKCCG